MWPSLLTWTLPLLLLGFVVLLELSTAYIVEPLLFGHSTGVLANRTPVVAAAFWAWLWGPDWTCLVHAADGVPGGVGTLCPAPRIPRRAAGVQIGHGSRVHLLFASVLLARDQDEATDVVNSYVRTHPPETLYDAVLLPALVLAKRDRNSGELSPDDERFIFHVTRAILDDLEFVPPIPTESAEAVTEPRAQKILVLACPACDEADELALRMFRRLLDPNAYQTEVLSGQDDRSGGHFADLGEKPDVICIGALPPGGLVQTRYLCKRLRASFPHQKIIIICWGLPDNAGPKQEELLAAGADVVAITLQEARTQLVQFVPTEAEVHIAAVA